MWDDVLRANGIDPDKLKSGDVISLGNMGQETPTSAEPPTASRMKPKTGQRTTKSDAERLFDRAWARYGDPSLTLLMEYEYQFAPPRRWRADRAFVQAKLLIEIEGMTSSAHESRHRSVRGFMDDCEKYNTAAVQGWITYRIPSWWLYDGKTGRAEQVIRDIVTILHTRSDDTSWLSRDDYSADWLASIRADRG
jgi:hypothetical protein